MALDLQNGSPLQLQDGTDLELQAGVGLVIVGQPADRSVYSGGVAQFFCSATGGTEPYTYQWYETTAGLLAGETLDSLDVEGIPSIDGNGYYCIVTDAALDTAQTDTAILTVMAGRNEYVEDIRVKRTDGVWVSVMGDGSDPSEFINDTNILSSKTWSSRKINDEINNKLNISDLPHALYGPMHPDVLVDVPAANTDILAYEADGAFHLGRRNYWRGAWVSGTYEAHEQVTDDGWLMIANKTTTDRPAPQAVGEPVFVYDGTAPSASASVKQIVFGSRYTTPADYIYQLSRVRVHTAIGNTYRVFAVKDPLGTPVYRELALFTATVDGWLELGIDPILLYKSTTFDFAAIVTEPDPTPTTFTGNWDYQTPQSNGAPASGVILHPRGQPDIFNVSKTDNDTVDRTTALSGLTVGDIIDYGGGGVRWAIQNIVDNSTYYTYSVSPAVTEVAGVNLFTFETVTAKPITRMADSGWWTANSPTPSGGVVQGLYIEDGKYSDITPDGNAYGTDIEVQLVDASDDWDVQAASEAGVSVAVGDDYYQNNTVYDFAAVENGFVDRSKSVLSFDDSTRTLTIEPVSSPFIYVQNRETYIVYGERTATIPDTEGLYYFYFDGDGLQQTSTFTKELITDYAFVSVVYWDADNNAAIFFGDERHGNTMDSTTHSYNHLTLGARFQSGLSLGDMDVDGSGSDATAAQFSVADGFIWDEDIQHHIEDGSPQTLSTAAEIPMYYRSGATGLWRKVAATAYPITTAGTGRPAWNEFTGGAWQLTEVASNDFVLTHYYATNDMVNPIVGIVGQTDYATLADARDGAPVEINNLAYGALGTLTPEFVPIATVIWETKSSYSNAVKAIVKSTGTGDDYIDWRFRRGGVAASV